MVKSPENLEMTKGEKEVSVFLSSVNINWMYHTPVILVDEEELREIWNPSFYLYEFGIYVVIINDANKDSFEKIKSMYQLNKIPVIYIEVYKEQKKWKFHLLNQILQIQHNRTWILNKNVFKTIKENKPIFITQKEMDLYKDKLDKDKIEKIILIKRKSKKSEKSVYAGKDIKKICEKYPRAYHHWTEEEDKLLTELQVSGKTIKELSDLFERQPTAIESHLIKLKEIEENIK